MGSQVGAVTSKTQGHRPAESRDAAGCGARQPRVLRGAPGARGAPSTAPALPGLGFTGISTPVPSLPSLLIGVFAQKTVT